MAFLSDQNRPFIGEVPLPAGDYPDARSWPECGPRLHSTRRPGPPRFAEGGGIIFILSLTARVQSSSFRFCNRLLERGCTLERCIDSRLRLECIQRYREFRDTLALWLSLPTPEPGDAPPLVSLVEGLAVGDNDSLSVSPPTEAIDILAPRGSIRLMPPSTLARQAPI